MNDAVRFYATPGPLTDLGPHAEQARALSADPARLVAVVQGLVVHPFLASLYGLDPKLLPADDVETRSAAAIVDLVLARDPAALDRARPPERRFVGNCRHFSVLLAALLRAHGVPARPRCGFGAYFERGRFVDHWVCEVWDPARGAWRLIDAQIDALQRQRFGLTFDPRDVPYTEFLLAGEAWQRCRSRRADADRHGILDMWGLWFVRGNVVRDIAALAKRELLPWDSWGMMSGPGAAENDAELALLDRAAALSLAGDAAHAERLALYDENPAFRVPRSIWGAARREAADVGEAVAAPARSA